MNCDTPINHKDGIATIRAMSGWPMRPAFHPQSRESPICDAPDGIMAGQMGETARHGVSQGRSCASPWASSGRQDFPRIRPPSGVSVFPPVIVRRLRRLRAALVRTVHCSSHAHRPVSLVPPTISGRIPVFLRYINIYISIIAGSRDAYFAGTRHCARVTSRCATPHRVTL